MIPTAGWLADGSGQRAYLETLLMLQCCALSLMGAVLLDSSTSVISSDSSRYSHKGSGEVDRATSIRAREPRQRLVF
jgi:hypothetical protein